MPDYIRRAFYHYTGRDLRVMSDGFQARFACLPPDAILDDIEFVTGPLNDDTVDPEALKKTREWCEPSRAYHDFSTDDSYNICLDDRLRVLVDNGTRW